MLSDLTDSELPARLRSLHYPAPLDWIRVDDILRLVGGGDVDSHGKAFRNRWSSKDDFIRDCLSYTMLYHDRAGDSLAHAQGVRQHLSDHPGSVDTVAQITEVIMDELLTDPRSLLLAHIAPVLRRSRRGRAGAGLGEQRSAVVDSGLRQLLGRHWAQASSELDA